MSFDDFTVYCETCKTHTSVVDEYGAKIECETEEELANYQAYCSECGRDVNKYNPEVEAHEPEDKMRVFASGATRNIDTNKLDYEGFISPEVLKRYAEYMHSHRIQADGKLRDSDNWQKGIPIDAYMKSGYRHFLDWWFHHRNVSYLATEKLEESICALLFNAMGYLHECLKQKGDK